MTILASTWLALAIVLCGFAWAANRRGLILALPAAVIVSAACLWVPTGSPRFTRPPPGHYTILGAKIVPEEAIYVLLDNGSGPPVYYVLPYSEQKAGELQSALYEAEQSNGQGVQVEFGADGGESYDGPPPVTAPEEKTPEQPMFSE